MEVGGVRRFLSKREGKRKGGRGDHHHLPHPLSRKEFSTSSPELAPRAADPNSAQDFYGLFDAHAPHASSVEEPKIRTIRDRMLKEKGVLVRDAQILWTLRSMSTNGEVDSAYALLRAMSDASEGIVRPYDPYTKMLGAQNRQGVTCFLDATLFSMFSRLDSFEAMLYNTFNDVSRNKLAFLLRLWVNLLRSGRLITTDITKVIQDTLADCGWEEAKELHQQDASEAFTFITGKLDLPLLTLKMDVYHTGKEDSDDHKLINERLLEVAIPADANGERKEITLEECLEDYFNNRIEVRRFLERRSTINSIRKGGSVHVETVELDGDQSPITPLSPAPTYASPIRPAVSRTRAPSIIQERYIPARNESGYSSLAPIDSNESGARSRAGSMRKEVIMPAWQFFSLIPWYTDNAPVNDAQVAAHFSTKRPILGLCLKRYSYTPEGKAIRLATRVDIPVEVAVPHFIQDDKIAESNGLNSNFKLSLQAAVCHRGDAVDSGHYVALVRGTAALGSPKREYSHTTKVWMRFDDLAPHRITVVDIETALKEETPYLLFYQIVPIDGDPGSITTGEDTLSTVHERNASLSEISDISAITDTHSGSRRQSFEVTLREDPRGRSPTETRRASVISFQEPPSEHTSGAKAAGLSVPNGDPAGTPRPQSLSRSQSKASDTGGLGRTLSKLRRKSREVLPLPADGQPSAEIAVKPVSDPTKPAPPPVQHTAPPNQQHNIPKPATLQIQQPPAKAHKREKSRGRRSRSKAGEKPDRECIVM
ncbi:hypothetical protein H2200_011950 [Cladophialophora chaetospira]|uniref:ubiquitinyl hydrolase 1 n=1 Tax=Cladophialophora chaetospira TaxID=386627 RepID=A0AA38WZ08_9EURO|nr:hypothetical protein H2200_011950 [Cladophialophora chaetospira]